MKRCPQCHFTFSDEQQFCDFDHTELTFIVKPSRNTPAAPAGRSQLVAAIVALSIAEIVLLIGYVDSAKESGLVNPNSESHQTLIPVPQLPREKSNQEAVIDPSIKTAKPRSISTQRQLTASHESSSMPSSILKWKPKGSSAARRQSTTKRAATAQAVPTKRARPGSTEGMRPNKAMYAGNHESIRTRSAEPKNSKVVAILKKTGSVLTRPFRF